MKLIIISLITWLFISINDTKGQYWKYSSDYILIESLDSNNSLLNIDYSIDIENIDSSTFFITITNSTTNHTIYDLHSTYLEYIYDEESYDNCHILNDGEFIIVIRQCVKTDIIVEITMITIDNNKYDFERIVFGSHKSKL